MEERLLMMNTLTLIQSNAVRTRYTVNKRLDECAHVMHVCKFMYVYGCMWYVVRVFDCAVGLTIVQDVT